jgi:hypothetical protein
MMKGDHIKMGIPSFPTLPEVALRRFRFAARSLMRWGSNQVEPSSCDQDLKNDIITLYK